MTRPLHSRISRLGQRFNLEDISFLLDFLDGSALLIKAADTEICAANLDVSKLFVLTTEELNGACLIDFFPELEQMWEEIVEAIRKSGKYILPYNPCLITKNNEQISVKLDFIPFDKKNEWLLIRIEEAVNSQFQKDTDIKRFSHLSELLELSRSLQRSKPGEALEITLGAGSRLIGANSFAIYIGDGQEPILKRVAGTGTALNQPISFPYMDINYLLEEQLWIKGQRAISTTLHREADTSNLPYLATSPIGEGDAWIGVIACTGDTEPQDVDILPLLKIIAQTVSNIIQKNILVTNLRQSLEYSLDDLAIGDVVTKAINDGIVALSSQLNIIKMNPSAELILGYSNQDVIGEPIGNIIIGTNSLLPALEIALQGIPTHNLGNIRLHRRDGNTFPAHIQTIPVIKNDVVTGAIIVLSDISEHEQTSVRTRQLEQRALLGQVTAIFAHEVGNPINNISTGLELISMDLPENDPKQERISELIQQCARLSKLMESVLTFSRTGSYNIFPITIGIPIQNLLKRWRPRMSNLKIKHHIQIAPNTPRVMGDRIALEQVFTNILSNAVKAMSGEGGILALKVIPITAPSGRNMVQIDISDTGPGIPAEIIDRVFEPFFTTDSDSGGTGLGLAITKQIITAHKGNITVDSFPGGTVFHIVLPAEMDNMGV